MEDKSFRALEKASNSSSQGTSQKSGVKSTMQKYQGYELEEQVNPSRSRYDAPPLEKPRRRIAEVKSDSNSPAGKAR